MWLMIDKAITRSPGLQKPRPAAYSLKSLQGMLVPLSCSLTASPKIEASSSSVLDPALKDIPGFKKYGVSIAFFKKRPYPSILPVAGRGGGCAAAHV